MRRASSLSSAAMRVQDLAEAFLRARLLVGRACGSAGRDRHDRRLGAAAARGVERRLRRGSACSSAGAAVEAGELVPFLAVLDRHALLEARHLVERHQAGVVVLVAGEGQALALDGVGDEAGRLVVARRPRRRRARPACRGRRGWSSAGASAASSCCSRMRADAGILAEVARQRLAPAGAALEDQRRVERVGAVVDPFAQVRRRRAGRTPPPAACRISA